MMIRMFLTNLLNIFKRFIITRQIMWMLSMIITIWFPSCTHVILASWMTLHKGFHNNYSWLKTWREPVDQIILRLNIFLMLIHYLVIHLNLLFCDICKHWYVLEKFGSALIIPLIKDKSGNVNDIDNYRDLIHICDFQTSGRYYLKLLKSFI